MGLSPRVRGNPRLSLLALHCTGSIPACTGEPPVVRRSRLPPEVYPRVYGGTVAAGVPVQQQAGLSPRVRGNRSRRRTGPTAGGSIPACTGEPMWEMLSSNWSKVYPRVYGGTRRRLNAERLQGGLSPRVRGNQRRPPSPRIGRGSIPACTGEPRSTPESRAAYRVYPRVYGGTWCTMTA